MKKIFIFLLFIWAKTEAQKNNIIGIVKDSATQQTIPYSSITNLYTNKTTIANKQGIFTITIKENQLLSFASMGYNFDTVRINKPLLEKDTVVFYLSQLTHKLLDVTIISSKKYNAYQLDSIERRKDFFQTMSEHTQPVISSPNSGMGFGIGINLDHFYNREKRKRNVIAMFDAIENEQYINYRFNPEIVTRYASLSSDSLVLFMQQYRPTYTWLRKHTKEEDILYYMNEKLKAFFSQKQN